MPRSNDPQNAETAPWGAATEIRSGVELVGSVGFRIGAGLEQQTALGCVDGGGRLRVAGGRNRQVGRIEVVADAAGARIGEGRRTGCNESDGGEGHLKGLHGVYPLIDGDDVVCRGAEMGQPAVSQKSRFWKHRLRILEQTHNCENELIVNILMLNA